MRDATDMWAALPAADVDRARRFYGEQLGLTPTLDEGDEVFFGDGPARFLLFKSSGAATGAHTQAFWAVPDVRAAVAELQARGVVFEEYDIPGLTREGAIVDMPTEWAAWFHDSEGNLLAVVQRKDPGSTSAG
jgi:predicted enzyme related to lactoylglutathione lyase